MLDQRPQARQIDGVAIAREEHDVRVADVDGERPFERLPGDRHRRRVHRMSERNLLPAEAREPHVDSGGAAVRGGAYHPAGGLDAGLAALDQGDAARGVAARFHLAAVGVPDPHSHVRDPGRLEHDHLVAADPGPTVGDRPGARLVHRHRAVAGVEDDEIVAEPVHFAEARHGRGAI